MRTAKLVSALVLSGATLAGASAHALPEVKVAGDVQYMTGGIGSDESQAMQAQARQWPLALEFATRSQRGAEWLADVHVDIADARGTPVLSTTSDGPLLMAKLAPGTYTVRASADGRTLERKLRVVPGKTARAVFVWPQGTDLASR